MVPRKRRPENTPKRFKCQEENVLDCNSDIRKTGEGRNRVGVLWGDRKEDFESMMAAYGESPQFMAIDNDVTAIIYRAW